MVCTMYMHIYISTHTIYRHSQPKFPTRADRGPNLYFIQVSMLPSLIIICNRENSNLLLYGYLRDVFNFIIGKDKEIIVNKHVRV